MRAIILAGGEGTRLRPLTNTIPKSLIPVQGKTLTEHVFDIYKKIGVTDYFLSVCYMADKIKEYFGDGSEFGCTITYIEEQKRRGTAGPLLILRQQGKVLTKDFHMCNSDNLFALDLNEMLEIHKSNNAVATIALTEVEDPTRGGVARLEGNRIIEFVERPTLENAPSHWLSSGFYILSPEIFNYIPDEEFVMLEQLVWPAVAKAGKLYGYTSTAQWFDTGTPQRYAQVEAEWRGV